MTNLFTPRGMGELTLGLILAVAFMEIVLHGIERSALWRVLPVVERELGWPDPELGYALRANHEIVNVREHRARVRTNAYGMRDRGRQPAKQPHAFRVALTGDSFTEALQVPRDATFSAMAEEQLNAGSASRHYEILNFGMSGAGPVQQLLMLEARAARFSPDAAILMLNSTQLFSTIMSDDSIQPAYVPDPRLVYAVGRSYRERSSQRLRDSAIGRFFFLLMDHSRVARAAYLYLSHGGPVAVAMPVATAVGCQTAAADFRRRQQSWQAAGNTADPSRAMFYLDRLAAYQQGSATPVHLAFYDIPSSPPDCLAADTAREALIATMRHTVASRDLAMTDVAGAVRASDSAADARPPLRGFGHQRGTGHLNFEGHRAYAEIVAGMAERLAGDR